MCQRRSAEKYSQRQLFTSYNWKGCSAALSAELADKVWLWVVVISLFFSSLLFRTFSPSSQTRRHMSKGEKKYWTEFPREIREAERNNRRESRSFLSLSLPLSHSLTVSQTHIHFPHKFILHSLLIISFSNYRLNMRPNPPLLCLDPSLPDFFLSPTHTRQDEWMNYETSAIPDRSSINRSLTVHTYCTYRPPTQCVFQLPTPVNHPQESPSVKNHFFCVLYFYNPQLLTKEMKSATV